ncbi:MAG: hypothetical protein WCL27_04340 [Betaproteobacteria bacterium]
MQLTLLVPELIWPEPADQNTFENLASPELNTLIARSRLSRRPPQSFEATLSDNFGQPDGAPYAALRLSGEPQGQPDTTEGLWIACDPVHLRFHQEHLILAEMSHLGISLEEAQVLVAALNSHLPETGRFHALSADRWYLQVTDTQLLDGFEVPPLSLVAGRRIERVLADSSQSKGLRRLLNEIQMLLHAHPINRQRENEGRMTINSLWLWGAGQFQQRTGSAPLKPFDGVWSNNPLANGLAGFSGATSHPVPPEATMVLAQAKHGSKQLVVLEDLLNPVHYENSEDYRRAITALENNWFAPLKSALAAGKISQLRIEACTAYATLSWTCQRHDLWKFWHQPHSLAELAQQLAQETP